MVATLSVFTVSLAGIIVLLCLKAWEVRRARIFFPRIRARMDSGASFVKESIEALEARFTRLPSFLTYVLMKILALTSVSFARWARAASEAAHRLADFISHKHNFERRELRSEFLKTMIEHKNGLAKPLVNVVKKQRIRKPALKIEPETNSSSEMQQ